MSQAFRPGSDDPPTLDLSPGSPRFRPLRFLHQPTMKNPITALVFRHARLAAVIAACICPLPAADVFVDTFDRADANTGTTNGSTAVGNGWTFQSDTQDPARGGARINGNLLQINQTSAGGYAGAGGSDRSWVWQDTTTWASPFTSTLANNPETVVWTFNMRTGQPNPAPVSTSGGGTVVAVLATAEPGSGDWQFGGNATGYFVTYNSSSITDPLKLVRMQNGVRNEGNHTTLISATLAPFNDLSGQHLSVKVTYDPASHTWRLHARDDGGVFQDPRTGTLNLLGSATDSTYTATALPYMGFFGNSNNGINGDFDDLRFDHLAVSLLSQAEDPVFSVADGTYADTQTVAISSAPAAATIRYTTDGSEPTSTTGTIYTGPVDIGPSFTTLKAIAYRAGLTDSAVTTATYSFETGSPVFNPGVGAYVDAQNVTITSATPGATIHYTIDGSDPTTTTGTVYTGPVAISEDTTLKAIAFADGFEDSVLFFGDYFIQTGTPVFTPGEGTYANAQNVTITTPTAGATIHYTIDGSDPTTTTGTVYSGPVAISENTTLKAIAFKAGIPDSEIRVADYTFQVGAPLLSPPAGTYANAQNVVLTSATPGATIRYTTDGNDPTPTSGTVYTGPIALSTDTFLKAIAYKDGMAESEVIIGDYFFVTAAPLFSPGAGTYANTQNVTISSGTTGATIRYTTDGSDPTSTTGTIYTAPVEISATATLKAIAYNAGFADSAVASAVITIDNSFALALDDTFSDGDRTDGADPADSQWRLMSNVVPTTAGVVNGAFKMERTTSTSVGFNPHPVTTFPAQTLGVGQIITMSFDFQSLGGAGATSIRFGLYNSGGTNLSGDIATNPVNPGTVFQNDQGYSVFAPHQGTQPITLYSRPANTTNNTLQIAAGANTTVIGSQVPSSPTNTSTVYSASLTLERTGGGYNYTVSYAGTTFSGSTAIVNTTSFDTLSVFAITAQNQAFTLDNVRVSVTTPPSTNGLAAWRSLQGLPADGSQDNANPSGDGVANLLKYALNLAPNAGDLALPNSRALANPNGTTVAELTGLPVLRLNGTPAAVFTYIRRKAPTIPGITYSVQWSDGLGTWAANPAATEATLSLDGTWERVTLTDSFTTAQKPARFARLSVTAP
jgi:hypothetical protein